jgi:F-type H+-transporting ATPase subunit a
VAVDEQGTAVHGAEEAGAGHAEEHSPLEQFEIHELVPIHIGDLNLSFTNSSLFMLVAVGAVTAFMMAGMRRQSLVPGRFQSMVELSYEFIAGMVREQAGKEGRPYFPFLFTLFMFILFANSLGMIPYSFTVTSHIIVTFTLAAVVFVGCTIIGFAVHGANYLKLFYPTGAPVYMAPILVPIEMISYLSRPISLSIRLFANMMAGHTMLKVLGGFTAGLGLFFLAPLVVVVGLTILEFGIAFIQAYVFVILSSIYLHDALHLH